MSEDTIIREVDEELRRDRLRKLWRQAAPWVIGGAVAVVLGVGVYEGWTWWSKTQAAKSSDQFYAATKIADGTDVAAAKKALDDMIAQGSGGYPMLAQFREASLLASQGKIDEALAAYDSLSTSIANTHLRELALVLGANLLIDKGDVAGVQQRVGGSLTPASPMRDAAHETLALTQYKAGQLDDAMKNFQAVLDDPQSSRDTQGRVQIYMLQLQAEGAKAITPPTTDTTTSSAELSSASAPVTSSAASTAVDSSTELDVAPPPVVDTSVMSMAVPAAPSSEAIASSAVSSSAMTAASSSTPAASASSMAASSAEPVSSAPVASSAPAASSAAPVSSAAPPSSSAP